MELFRIHPRVNLSTFRKSHNSCPYSRNLVVHTNPPSEKALWETYIQYAPSARDAFFAAANPDLYARDVRAELAFLTPTSFSTLLLSPNAPETSHKLVLIEPSPTSRYSAQKKIITVHVFNLFWDQHQFNQEHEMARFYDLFRSNATASVVSGMIFEIRLHQLLKGGFTLILTPIVAHFSGKDVNVIYDDYKDTTEPDTRQIILGPLEAVPLTDGMTLSPGCYYRPQISNFPSIDAVVFLPSSGDQPPVFIIFQFTCNVEKHPIKKVGLERINKLVIPPNAEKLLVVVTPEDVEPKITVPRTYLTDDFPDGRAPNVAFPVYHLTVPRKSLFS